MCKQTKLNNQLRTILLETRRSIAFNKLYNIAIRKHKTIMPLHGSWNASMTFVNNKYQLWYNLPSGTTSMECER